MSEGKVIIRYPTKSFTEMVPTTIPRMHGLRYKDSRPIEIIFVGWIPSQELLQHCEYALNPFKGKITLINSMGAEE